MSMPKVIIDGYNVIYSVPELAARASQDLAEARAALVQRLASYVSRRRVEVVVVFDGSTVSPAAVPGASPPGVRVLFSRPPANADSVIEHLIGTEARPRNLTLVTGDRHLIQVAQGRGAKVLPPLRFVGQLGGRPPAHDVAESKFNSQLSEEEVREWLSLFGEHKQPRPGP